MKNILKWTGIGLGGGTLLLATVYWFNLDNKLIYYAVRPALNWWYDRQKRDVRL